MNFQFLVRTCVRLIVCLAIAKPVCGAELVGDTASFDDYLGKWALALPRLENFFHAEVRRAIDYPREPGAPAIIQQLDAYIAELDRPPGPFELPPLQRVDRLRWSAFLELAKLRYLIEMQQGRPDLDTSKDRRSLAESMLKKTGEAFALVDSVLKTNPGKAVNDWLNGKDPVADNIRYIKAHGHAVLWGLKVDPKRNKEQAKATWESIGSIYASIYPPATEDMERIAMPLLKDPSQIPHIAFVGVGMLVLGLLLTWFTKAKRGPVQTWALRVFLCIGAGMAASGIHGSLELSYNGWISAGGAMGILVLFYLKNPPPLNDGQP